MTDGPAPPRAWVCAQPGDYHNLALATWTTAGPGPEQVAIAPRAVSVGFPEMLMTQGLYQLKPDPPFVPGMELAGEVIATGSAVDGLRPGDRVMATVRFGAYAERVIARAADTLPLPPAFDFATGAGFLIAYKTAYVALVSRGALAAGETVLVHGAAGGVGLATVDLARTLGATVIATASTAAKRQTIAARGADFVLDSGAADLRDQVLERTAGRGVDMVVDPVGGDIFDISLRCLAPLGRLLVVGFAGGRIASAPTNYALIKQLSIIGVRAGEYGRLRPEAGRAVNAALLHLADAGRLRPHVHARMDFEHLLAAFDEVAGRRVIGRIVLDLAAAA